MKKDLELDYKHDVISILRGMGWNVQAHEDMIEKFIPDLSFGSARQDGWIELKYVNKLPKSLGAIPHFTHGQQEWLIKRGMKGSGHCYLLVGSPDGHFIWRWSALGAVRDLPWAEAVARGMSDADLGGLLRVVDAVVRQAGRY
jgi:hypothetical protein